MLVATAFSFFPSWVQDLLKYRRADAAIWRDAVEYGCGHLLL